MHFHQNDTSASLLILGIGDNPDSKVHGANMGPIWVLSAPAGPHVYPMNVAIRECINQYVWGYYTLQ